MYYLVCLSGLPSTITFRQVTIIVKDVKQHKVSYWIRRTKRSTDMRKILIEVYSKHHAEKLVTFLNGKSFVANDNITYACKAFVESKCEAHTIENPFFRKSLQANISTSKKKQFKNKDKELLPEKFKDNAVSSTPALPKFNHPMRMLMDEMDSLIKKYCSKQTELCLKALRVQLRMRLSQLFEGKRLVDVYAIPTPTILEMYRRAYNGSTDESFVKQTCNMVQTACWPDAETEKDGKYLEETEIQDEGVMNISSCKNTVGLL